MKPLQHELLPVSKDSGDFENNIFMKLNDSQPLLPVSKEEKIYHEPLLGSKNSTGFENNIFMKLNDSQPLLPVSCSLTGRT